MLFDFLHVWLVMVVFGWYWSFVAYGCLLASFISCMLGCLWLLLGGVGHLLFIDVCLLSSSDLLCLFVLFPYYFVLHFRMFTST